MSFLSLSLLLLAPIVLGQNGINPITTCPGNGDSVYTASDGSTWNICQYSDYHGDTDVLIPNVPDRIACAQQIQQYHASKGYTKAVYDYKYKYCHIKSLNGQLSWYSNPDQFDSIRLKADAPNGGSNPITACPNNGDALYTAPDGSKWNICQNSDYRGGSDFVFANVIDRFQCAQVAQQYHHLGYTKAVYDHQGKYCHLKTLNGQLDWYSNPTQYDSIRVSAEAPAANRGKWAPAVKLPISPAGAFVNPDQPYSYNIMGYSSWSAGVFGGDGGQTQFATYNWNTGAVSQRQVSNTKHDMFCPGQSQLGDGSLLITGGDTDDAVSRYYPNNNTWSRMANMTIGRGYQSSSTLSNGKLFTIGGSFTGGIGGQDGTPLKAGEIYDPTRNTWTFLPGADVRPMLTQYDREGTWRTDNHGWLFGWKSGSVFQAGPSRTMNWYSTGGQGAVVAAGTRDPANDAMCGLNAMYDAVAGKIFTAGGSQSYSGDVAFTKGFIVTIGDVNKTAQVESIAPLNYARGVGNIAVLPNGNLIVTGGQLQDILFTDDLSVFNAEEFDIVKKKWTVLAPQQTGRNYHSMSLLLADGRVWSGGGGLCYNGLPGGCPNNVAEHFDGEIFTPPYLMNADGSLKARPTITKLTSNTDSSGFKVRVGGRLSITMGSASTYTFSLVRLGSATHSVNTDQRRVPVSYSAKNGNVYTLPLPSDAGILLPGFYYVFAMDVNGVPAVARTVQVVL